jgi:hypothetical protein
MQKVREFSCTISNHNGTDLEWLEPAIKGWSDCINRYVDFHEMSEKPGFFHDVPYDYNERANVSLLAAGAYLGGLIAIEEYVTDKSGEQARRSGRADLFLSDEHRAICIECKRRVITPKVSEGMIAKAVDEAVSDAAHNTYEERCAGAVFFVPSLPRRRSPALATDDLKSLLERFDGIRADLDLFAYSLPEKTRVFVRNNRTWPGVILALRLVR